MREHARNNDFLSIGLSMKSTYEIRTRLGYGIRGGGMKRAGFVDGQPFPGDPTEDLRGGADMAETCDVLGLRLRRSQNETRRIYTCSL